MIEGVKVKELKPIYDDRGHLMEILRVDDEMFDKFGQAYITTAKPGIVKAWHYHKLQDDHFCCVFGKMRLALYDAREDSPTRGEIMEWELSLDNPKLVKIPAGVYHGFKGISEAEAIVVNVPTNTYDCNNPDEYRLDPFDNDIDYDWRRK
jgi:dTDP-4-dehydrorhamnose 3,5-epimerase